MQTGESAGACAVVSDGMAVLRWVPLVGLSVFLGCAGAAPSAPRTLAAAAPVPLTAAPSASAPPSSAAPDPQAALAAKVDPVFGDKDLQCDQARLVRKERDAMSP